MHQLLQILKKIIGESNTRKIRPIGHGIKSFLSGLIFGIPIKKLKLIGINATKGKTSTVILTGRLLNLFGFKTGYISTAIISLNGKLEDEFLNPYKMTTIDGFTMQKYLKSMVESGCKFVVVEMSSQGLEQNRHWGLGKFWITVFMNLYPEHIEAHGSLQKYLEAKSKLFEKLKAEGIFISTNEPAQQEYKNYLLYKAKKATNNKLKQIYLEKNKEYQVVAAKDFSHKNLIFKNNLIPINFLAEFEAVNLAYACCILEILRPNFVTDIEKFRNLNIDLPGRMEFVKIDKNDSNIDILVDYAHEPESLTQLLDTMRKWKNEGKYSQVIHILSSDGVGRDDWKKPIMGKLSSDMSDFTILTTDNYGKNDIPEDIVNLLSGNISPKLIEINIDKWNIYKNTKVYKVINRLESFKFSLKLANKFISQDQNNKILICSTGVGAEQGLTQPEGVLKWDEREVWKGLLQDIQA